MPFIKFRIIFITFFACIHLSAISQELVFVNCSGTFREETEIYIHLQLDRKPAVDLSTKTARINLSSYSFDSIATLTVKGMLIHKYTNQYFPEQFRKLDTITLYQSQRIDEPTPRFFLKMNYNIDSAVIFDAGILKNFLDEASLDSTFVLEIYHSRTLSKKEEQRIQTIKTAFCKEVGVDEKSVQLVDKQAPYSTARFDFFNPGTIITKQFIQQQNTPWMKAKAEEYSLVLMVNMIWKQ